MSLATWATYTLFVFFFMIVPGPSHLLMISNSMASGFRRSVACAAGDLSANTIQILIAGFGIGLASGYGPVLFALKLAGIAYLFYLGASMAYRSTYLGAQAKPLHEHAKPRATLFFQGFMTSIINPKAVIFFSALFPQFITPDQTIWPQLLALGLTYIVIDGAFLTIYGVSAHTVASRLSAYPRTIRIVPACIMLLTAVILGWRIMLHAV